ncbi:PaaX family transcriptional regulator C-terminal domain-containing protein [Actinoplanes sp. NPDC049118]|uniref:PaaX family transcriptional regulator n=1 Tax=Actinoplanes sp. NPDC049118 TaxID=3155769 RepID=UPI0033C386A4
MTSPYDIEEIFPDDAAGAVRLPRRQAGNSPQDLTVTLLADYALRTREWLPSGAVVALLGEAGVSSAGARTAISRLARRGVLEGRRQGRQSSYRLTPAAAAFLTVGGSSIVSPADGIEPWDEHWTLIAFSMPQEESAQRRGLRTQLRWMGYAPLYDGLWISPRELSAKARAQLTRLTPGAMTVFRARHVDLGAANRRAPLDAWDTAAIAEQYESFIRCWSPTPPRIDAGEIAGAEAVRVRTEVMDTYRRLPILDPQLPGRLLPPGWLRGPARNLFVAIYDGLAETAQNHVRAVAARFAGAPSPGIRAHTVAELAAGLPDVQ